MQGELNTTNTALEHELAQLLESSHMMVPAEEMNNNIADVMFNLVSNDPETDPVLREQFFTLKVLYDQNRSIAALRSRKDLQAEE